LNDGRVNASIKLLQEEVISQIAAGEVVERPSSVIKELMENAIDADARTIQVATTDSGQRLMRVSDDGTGIPADEVTLAFMRHATSKLNSIHDLERIGTLGFRGEALASIAAVSHVTVTTRHHAENTGTRLRIEGGQIVSNQKIGAPAGTIMQIENLFYNTPARLKFMKKPNTERKHIASVVTQYAMAYPHIKFVLEQDGREVFRSSGSGQLADVVVKALGLETFRKMTEVSLSHAEIDVFGYVSLPEMHRSDRSSITLFVNGRAVQDSKLNYAVVQAYHQLMDSGKYPLAVLMIRLPPESVDVNVHPTKAEVRFSDPNTVFSVVQRAVREAVMGVERGESRVLPPRLSWDSPYAAQSPLNLNVEDAGRRPSPARGIDNPPPNDPTEIPVGLGAPAKPRTLPPLRVVGQVGAMYIVAEGPAGLYLIDQHAAHSRILYEQLTEYHTRGTDAPSQPIDLVTVTLPARRAETLIQWLEVLRGLGYALESFGGNVIAVRGLPSMLSGQDANTLLQELSAGLSGASHADASDRARKLTAHMGAAKMGAVLTTEQMQAIVRQLERCAAPLIDPDGSATLIHMSGDHIAREFKRG